MIRLIGYGNPGRGDDGLGPAFAARIVERQLPGLEVQSAYQLSVEHALWIAGAQVVVFADAALNAPEPVLMDPIFPAAAGSLASHALPPAAVLTLAQTLYGAVPEAYLLGIAGEAFGEVHEGLSKGAEANLETAEALILRWLAERRVPLPAPA